MGPYGSEAFKTLLLQIAEKSFQTCPEFFPSGPQNSVGDFWNFEVMILTICFRKFQIHHMYPMEKLKTSNIWKMSDRRAKWCEIWVLGVG